MRIKLRQLDARRLDALERRCRAHASRSPLQAGTKAVILKLLPALRGKAKGAVGT